MNSWPALEVIGDGDIARLKAERDGALKPSYRKLIWDGGTGWQRGPKFDSDGNWRERLLVLRYCFLFSTTRNLNFKIAPALNYNIRIRNYNVDNTVRN